MHDKISWDMYNNTINAATEKQFWEMTKKEFDDSVQKKKPREEFHVTVGGVDIEVIQNPESRDYRHFKKEFIREYPHYSKSEPATRSTQDINENIYLWRADKSMHNHIEPQIKKHIEKHPGQKIELGQNLERGDHRHIVQKALFDKKPVPQKVLDEYPKYKQHGWKGEQS